MDDDDYGIFETIYTLEDFEKLCRKQEYSDLFKEKAFVEWLVKHHPYIKKATSGNTIKILEVGNDECFFSVEGKRIPYRAFRVRWKNSQLNAFADFEVEIFQNPITNVYIPRNFDVSFYTDTKIEEFWEGMAEIFPPDMEIKNPDV